MSLFRNKIYNSNNYISSLHLENPLDDKKKIESKFKYYKYKYLPFFNNINPDESILELGCGSGDMLAFLRKNGFSNIFGIDISKKLINIAVKRNLNVDVADVLEYLKQKKNQYNTIIAIDFIEHFTKNELFQLFPIIFKSIKKNGNLIIQTPNGIGLFPNQVIYDDLTHLTIFTPNSIKQMLEYHGFTDIEFHETGPIPNNIIGFTQIILWKIIKIIFNVIRKIETGKSQKILTENLICFCKK